MIRPLMAMLGLLLSAVAVAKHVYPQNLTPIEGREAYRLAEDYVFQEKAATFTLFAGTYTPKYEDRRATYLIGDGPCLEMRVVPPKNPAAAWADRWGCGIYLPKDPAQGAAFFVIRRKPEQPQSGNGLLIDSIIEAGYGSFDFPTSRHDDAALRERLAPATPPAPVSP